MDFGIFKGSMTYGLIPYGKAPYPLPVFRLTKEIKQGEGGNFSAGAGYISPWILCICDNPDSQEGGWKRLPVCEGACDSNSINDPVAHFLQENSRDSYF